MTNYKTLLVTTPAEHVTLITLNRPDAANAFNTQMAVELTGVFAQLDPALRCMVLTG